MPLKFEQLLPDLQAKVRGKSAIPAEDIRRDAGEIVAILGRSGLPLKGQRRALKLALKWMKD